VTATTPSGPSTPSDAVPAVEATPVWKRPKWVLAGIGTLVLLGLMWRYGGGNVRFSTDLRPKPNTTFDWDYFWALVPDMLRGLFLTVQATLLGFAIALVLGLFLAVGRRSRIKLISWPITFLIEFIRSTPLLIQLFFLYYVLPEYGLVLPAFMTGALALGLQYSAYTSEVYRAGLQAIGRDQREAARALNFPSAHTFTHVLLPQAIPRIIPAMGNYLVSIMKDVPVLSVVTVLEMLNVAKIIGDRTFDYMVPLSMVGGLYLIMTLVASAGVRLLDTRLPKQGLPLK